MSDFRQAMWIELHRVNIVIAAKDTEAGWFWHWFNNSGNDEGRPLFEIKASDIAVICEVAGLNFARFDQGLNSTARINPVTKKRVGDTVADYRIKVYGVEPVEVEAPAQLLARVEAANLLSIKAVHEGENGDGWTDEFTYSGEFTVQWAQAVEV